MAMIEHRFKGDGIACEECKAPRKRHRAPRKRLWHVPAGDPCDVCGKAARLHVSERVVERRAARDQERPNRHAKVSIIGIDGEGHDTPDGRHLYTYLCAVNEDGKIISEAENPNGITTYEACEMLLAIPSDSLCFVFMGSYDWTKMIEDLELVDRYYIMHPDARRRRVCKQCKRVWSGPRRQCIECGRKQFRTINKKRNVLYDKHGRPCPYSFDWMNGSFTVSDHPEVLKQKNIKTGRSRKVWDCFKFFQSSFVKAIEAWKVGTPEQVARIKDMKSKRGSFDVENPENVKRYCQEECHLLAVMMRKLIDACQAADIVLKRFDGAGAIANALLKKHDVQKYLGPPLELMSLSLEHAVMSAYVGGRFENSWVGVISGKTFPRDIHSAYPYAIAQLPCLACGRWNHFKPGDDHPNKKLQQRLLNVCRASTLAVVRYRVKPCPASEREKMAWAPLPYRDENGSICWPTGCEGWAWLPEIEAALRGWPDLIEIIEAHVYRTECEHKPFGWMPEAYRLRCQWGKDGPGIVMKLGVNACAGKTMQSLGDAPPFKSWIWGGMITSTTRAQALDGITCAKDRWDVLAIATDGLFARVELNMPKAKDLGTHDLPKPLGEWGRHADKPGDPDYVEDMFLVKPGMYYDDGKGLMRARGIGRKELTDHSEEVIQAFKQWDRKKKVAVRVLSRRFYGARSTIYAYSRCNRCNISWPGPPEQCCPKCMQIADVFEVGEQTLPDTVCTRCGYEAPSLRERPEVCPGTLDDGAPCGRPWHPPLTSSYGRWAARPIEIDFACFPKRECVSKRGEHAARMRLRDVGGAVSMPYTPGQTTPEGLAARAATEEGLEQPDWEDGD